LLNELDISVFPAAGGTRGGGEVPRILDERSTFLEVIKRCGAILLINGNVKEEDQLWVDGRVADIKFDIQRKLGGRLPYAIIDAPPGPRLEPLGDVRVFPADSPTLKRDLQRWLRTLNTSARQLGRSA
jgi:hypothetical protein